MAKTAYRTQALPASQRPERRVADAPNACNMVELLAALIGGPKQLETAEALLAYYGSLRAIRAAAAPEIAANIPGIGQATATRLISALELGQRLVDEANDELQKILSPADAAALIQYEMGALEQEEMRVILLDTRMHLIDIVTVYRGSVNSTQVRVGELFKAAIRRNAPNLIVAHNHPSSDPTPSPDDVAITRAVVQAGKMLDISVLDHLVIGGKKFVSLKERGLGFDSGSWNVSDAETSYWTNLT